jgi:hypothetical protein
MERRPFRQGDVLLVPVDAMPGRTRRLGREQGRIVLAEGEKSGHAHAVSDPGADLYELVLPGDVSEMRRRFLRVEREVSLVHEEHAVLKLPPGDYEVIRQVEHTGTFNAQVVD